MANLNKIFLIGRLTRDPELRHLPNGTPKAELRLASSREWKDKNGEKQKETLYVDIVVWSRQAEIAHQYLKKGRQIFVEGRLDYREWEGKDGTKRSKHEVVADFVQFLDRGDGAPGQGGEASYAGAGGGDEGGEFSGGGGGGYGRGNGGGYGGGGGYGNGGGYGGGRSQQNVGKTYGGNAEEPQGGAPMTEVMGVNDADLPF
jgi:single-strand DNA-binding protein